MAFTKVVGAGIHTLSNIASHNINSSGIITATKFVGPIEGNITAVDGVFSGNVSIAKTLTYEDVKNVDSVGVGTFREGIFIPDNKKLEIGNVSGSGDLQIYHNTLNSIIKNNTGELELRSNVLKILGNTGAEASVFNRTGSVDLAFNGTKKFETTSSGVSIGGTTIITSASGGKLGIGTNVLGYSTADDLTIATSGSTGITIRTGTTNQGNIYFADGTSGASQYAGLISYNHNTNHMFFGTTDGTERLRISSTGKITHTYDGTAYNAQYGQFEITKAGAGNTDPDWSYLSLHRQGQIAWHQGIDSNHFVIASTGGGAKDTLDAEKFRITSAGDVGIGLTNPSTKLHIREAASGY